VFIRLWRLLDLRDRRRVMWIIPLLITSAMIEVAGVAVVIPFLSLLADPRSAETVPALRTVFGALDVSDPLMQLRWTGIMLATILLIANALVILTQWWLLRFVWSLNHRLSTRLLRHYLSQPYAFVLTRNTAALANKVIVEVRQLMEEGLQSSLEIVTRTAVIVALVGFLVMLDPLLAVIVFGILGSAYSAIFFVSRRYLRRIGRESVALGSSRLKAVNEALGGFKDLKVTGREASALDHYDAPTRRFGEVHAAQRSIAMLPRYALEAVAVGGMVLVSSLMAGRPGTFASTLPLLGAYAFAGLRLMPAMQQLFRAVARSRFAAGSLEAVESDFLAVDSGEGDLDERPDPPPFERSIMLRNIHFAYRDAEGAVLDGLTLEIARRQSLALVGRTGSGKTTLVDVILGLLTPDSGVIEVDGVPVTAAGRRAYRLLFGYVPQSVYLLDDTIARNVALGLSNRQIDMDAIRRACELAQISEFIERELPDGYATVVGERGVRLSGGQRQRLAIARALYHKPQVLVFDEATSALDMHTERQLYEALEAIARTHTVITIAHRLDTVAKADTAVVLANGRVVDHGPPAEVLSRYRHGEDTEVASVFP
jgi:ATP-binding cassette, subfamily B, bacterial PglK